MTKEIIEHRKLVINEIKAGLDQIDAGQFQLFCLDILPLCSDNYQGLERHGGTATGKTRSGTPDLIKTLPEGQEIAVQCSTLENYWHAPKDKKSIDSWKPIADIKKCSHELTKLKEIVLCSNREIPTTNPNIKSDIIEISKAITTAKITLLNRADIERILLENIGTPTFEKIAKAYFPEVASLINTLNVANGNQLAIELTREQGGSLDTLLKIAHAAVSSFNEPADQKAFALEEINQLCSRFQRHPLPSLGTIIRKLPSHTSFNNPCGVIQVLTGVPKIGKTGLTCQLAKSWVESGLDVRWFETPNHDTEQSIFIQDFLKNLWALFIDHNEAYEISTGTIQLHSIDLKGRKYRNEKQTVYIIDNLEQLDIKYLKQLFDTFSTIKKLGYIKNIGVFLLTNKNIKHVVTGIDFQSVAPQWPKEELAQFLLEKIPGQSYFNKPEYLQILESRSSGHPLIALALARKYQSVSQLLLSGLSGPSLGDEELATKITQLLFNELVPDVDAKNFIVRLSQLIYKVKSKVLLCLIKINPPISTPINLIINQLTDTVIEGNETEGYSVPFVYKEVAKEQITKEQRKEIYDAVSLSLLIPEGKFINAEETLDGVLYAIFAGEMERAMFWATMLLQALQKDKVTEYQIKSILNRLNYLKIINPPKEERLLLLYYGMLINMATAYIRIGEYKNATDIFEKIKLPDKITDKRFEEVAKILINSIALFKVVVLAVENPKEAAKILISINFSDLKQFKDASLISEIGRQLLAILSIKDIMPEFVNKVFEMEKTMPDKQLGHLLDLVTHLGLKGSKDGMALEDITKLLPSTEFADILHAVIACQYYLDTEVTKCISYAEEALNLFNKHDLSDLTSKTKLTILLADVYYKAGKFPQAIKFYIQAKELCNIRSHFDYAWIHWRLGLLSEKPEEAEVCFKKSANAFIKAKNGGFAAKSYGEKSIALVQQDKYEEYADLVFFIINRYYLRRDELFAPTAMVAMAQAMRLIKQIEKKPVEVLQGYICPDFKRGTFNNMSDMAKPIGGTGLAFYTLSQLYDLLGIKSKKVKCLSIALETKSMNEMEQSASSLIIKDLLEELVIQKNYEKIYSLILKGIDLQKLSNLSLPYLSHIVFSSLDTLINSLSADEYQNILNIIDRLMKTINDGQVTNNQDWWLAELYSRKFRANRLMNADRVYLYELSGKAYEYGLKANNTSAIIEGGYLYGYPDEIWHMSLVVEIQFNVMKAIKIQNSNFEILSVHGQNMYRYWLRAKYKRISTKEIKIYRMLSDYSKMLSESKMKPDNAAPIMLLLLASLYEYHGEPTKWARNQIKSNSIPIPLEVFDHIKLYLA